MIIHERHKDTARRAKGHTEGRLYVYRKDTKTRSDELKDTMKDDKKEMKDKMELEYQGMVNRNRCSR